LPVPNRDERSNVLRHALYLQTTCIKLHNLAVLEPPYTEGKITGPDGRRPAGPKNLVVISNRKTLKSTSEPGGGQPRCDMKPSIRVDFSGRDPTDGGIGERPLSAGPARAVPAGASKRRAKPARSARHTVPVILHELAHAVARVFSARQARAAGSQQRPPIWPSVFQALQTTCCRRTAAGRRFPEIIQQAGFGAAMGAAVWFVVFCRSRYVRRRRGQAMCDWASPRVRPGHMGGCLCFFATASHCEATAIARCRQPNVFDGRCCGLGV